MRSATILIVLLAAGVNFAAQPGPVSHTANFAGQSGWSSDGSTASSTGYDRYGQPIGISGATTTAPPSITSRAQQAFTETGTTISNGVDAGIRAANDQLKSFGNSVQATANQSFNQVSNQFQPISPIGTTTSAPPSATTTRAKNGVAPPPWEITQPSTAPSFSSASAPISTAGQYIDRTVSPGMVPTRTDTGWTSIGNSVAAPPLLISQLPGTSNSATQPRMTMASNGLTFPATTSTQPGESPQMHSLLTNNSNQPPAPSNTTNNWSSGWTNDANASGATIGRSNDNTRGSDLVAVQQPNANANARTTASQPASTNWDNPWGGAESWSGQNSQPPVAPPAITASQPAPGISATQSLGANPANQFPQTQTVNSPAIAGNNPLPAPPAGGNMQLPNPNRDASGQSQWLTLAVVLLSLVGSLSANVFLGMSYMDARQKYQSLVRRTADSFRRTTTAAA